MQLLDVCELIIDCEHKTAPTQETGYPSIRTPNIGRGRLILDGVNRVSEETYRMWTKRAVPLPGDLIMAREAPVGNVAMIPEGLRPCLGQRTLLIRPDRAQVDPSFLNYFLNGPHVQGLIRAKTNGATVAHLNMKDVRTMELPSLPPLPVQRRIAGILSAYDELMENSQRRIRILESMARALYREWFVHFRYPCHESVPRVDSPLGLIPQGWEVKTVKNVATVVYGFPFQSRKFNTDGIGTPVIRIRDILDGSTNTFTDEGADPKYHIKNGDILVGMDGDFHMCIWSSGHAFQNQRVAKFESKGEIGNYHLFLALELPIQTLNKSIVGTTVAHLGDMHIKTIQVAWPPAKILAKAGGILEPMSQQIIAMKRQIQNLRRTRDLLLPRLLSGQVSQGASAP
jgi:type I restriction enzyme S subunit